MSAFRKLWESFPRGSSPCVTDGKKNFENQCAIRLGACLDRAGVDTSRWPVRRCWQHKGARSSHILAAEELANALTRVGIATMGRVEKYAGKDGFAKIKGRTGIVFFRNFYGPGLQGDHIDLWDRWRTTDIWMSIGRIQLVGGGKYKDGNIWFWPIP